MLSFISDEIIQDISNTFASDRLVALRGYVPAYRQARFRVKRRSNQYAADLRERNLYQGGKQVVQDLTHRSSIFENPARLKSKQGSSFPGDCTIFPLRLQGRFNPTQLQPIEQQI